VRQGIWPKLKMDDERARLGLRRRSWCAGRRRIEAFDKNGCPIARSHPQAAAFPPAFGSSIRPSTCLAKNPIG